METSLARDLMSDEEWAFFERFILADRAPNGRKPTNYRHVLDGIFWIARTGARGVTCLKSSASGRASTGSSDAGHRLGSGKRSWAP
jgi:transposase